MNNHRQEVSQGKRYQFGKNWQRFLRVLDDERIAEAERSLKAMLQMETLQGKSFLDIGSGSGLFSLAAMRLGASRVHSFDYDPNSVACTRELKLRYFPHAEEWTIEAGSVIDGSYVSQLSKFDVVYSWGVLHHTGNMWLALENTASLVQQGGSLFIAIYNDCGRSSRIWKIVKKLYIRSFAWRLVITPIFLALVVAHGLALDLMDWENPLARYRDYKKRRGMSLVPDVFDWLGGYPFEFAKPEEIFDYYRRKGFILNKLTTSPGRGNNEFIFVNSSAPEILSLHAGTAVQHSEGQVDLGISQRQPMTLFTESA